jgi:hypothetical protein
MVLVGILSAPRLSRLFPKIEVGALSRQFVIVAMHQGVESPTFSAASGERHCPLSGFG